MLNVIVAFFLHLFPLNSRRVYNPKQVDPEEVGIEEVSLKEVSPKAGT